MKKVRKIAMLVGSRLLCLSLLPNRNSRNFDFLFLLNRLHYCTRTTLRSELSYMLNLSSLSLVAVVLELHARENACFQKTYSEKLLDSSFNTIHFPCFADYSCLNIQVLVASLENLWSQWHLEKILEHYCLEPFCSSMVGAESSQEVSSLSMSRFLTSSQEENQSQALCSVDC